MTVKYEYTADVSTYEGETATVTVLATSPEQAARQLLLMGYAQVSNVIKL